MFKKITDWIIGTIWAIFCIALILVVLTLCLSGCGGGSDDDDIKTTQPVHCEKDKCE